MNVKSKVFSLGVFLTSGAAFAADHLCFISGYQGGGPVIESEIPESLLNNFGISAKVFVPSYEDKNLNSHALDLRNWTALQVQQEAGFQCVAWIGYSMGGVISRLAMEMNFENPHTSQNMKVKDVVKGAIISLASPQSGFYVAELDETESLALSGMTLDSMESLNNPSSPNYTPWPMDKWILGIATYIQSESEARNFLEAYFFTELWTQRGEISDGLVEYSSQVGPYATHGLKVLDLNMAHSAFSQDANVAGLYAQIYNVVNSIFVNN